MNDQEQKTTDAADKAFAARIAEAFAPPEMTSAHRSTIDASVRARVEGGSRARGFLGALAGAAIAAGLVVLASRPEVTSQLPSGLAERPSALPERQVLAAEQGSVDVAWTYALLFDPSDRNLESDALEELPADYRAITDVLLDG